MSPYREAVRRRREQLLLALAPFGAVGAAVSELVDYWPTPGDRDPVRTVYLREQTVRCDLYELEASGRVQRAPGWKRAGGRQVIAWRATGGGR